MLPKVNPALSSCPQPYLPTRSLERKLKERSKAAYLILINSSMAKSIDTYGLILKIHFSIIVGIIHMA